LTSIKCRKTPNAYLIDKVGKTKDGIKKIVEKVSDPIKCYKTLKYKLICIILSFWISGITGIRLMKNKHNYFKSIGTELAKFPIEIMGFMVRPNVKPIFFSASHKPCYRN
jgi:hypothetical protein